MQPSAQTTSALDSEELLEALRHGDSDALQRLFAGLYSELHRRARGQLGRRGAGRPDHTLQPTALVNEAYLRVVRAGGAWRDREHFLYAASRAMRHVLVDHARRKHAGKRDGHRVELELENLAGSYETRAVDFEALDHALNRLAERDPTMAKAVELRFFGGLGLKETARLVDLSYRNFQRRWATVRAWLHAELG